MSTDALEVKVRSLYGKLLDKEGYRALIDKSEEMSREDLFTYLSANLSETSLKKFNSQPKPHRIRSFERLIRKDLLTKLEVLSNYLDETEKELYKAYLRKYEIKEIKDYLRVLLYSDENARKKLNDQSYYSEKLHFDPDNDVTGSVYLKKLEDRPYYRAIEPYVNADNASLVERSFYLEENLELWYYLDLNKRIKKLDKENRNSLKKIFGMKIDILNLERIYRSKRYRDLDNLTISNLLTPGGHKFNIETLNQLISLSSEELRKEISNTHYKYLFNKSIENDEKFNISAERFDAEYAQKLFRQPNTALVHLFAFTFLAEYQLYDITRIVECRDLGLSREKLKDYIIKFSDF